MFDAAFDVFYTITEVLLQGICTSEIFRTMVHACQHPYSFGREIQISEGNIEASCFVKKSTPMMF